MRQPSGSAAENLSSLEHFKRYRTTFQTGDRVGWSVEGELDPGEGIITKIFLADESDSETLYMIRIWVQGADSKHQIPLPESILYPISQFDAASQMYDPARVAPLRESDELLDTECVIILAEGSIRYTNPCTYVRVLNAHDEEIGRWQTTDWQTDPTQIIGEILSAAQIASG